MCEFENRLPTLTSCIFYSSYDTTNIKVLFLSNNLHNNNNNKDGYLSDG